MSDDQFLKNADFSLSSLLLVVPFSSVNMERLNDGNVELSRLLVVV